MAKKLQRKNGENAPPATAESKIANVLALIAIRDMEPSSAALKLDAIGFTPKEISALLDVGPNYVAMVRHRSKGGNKRKAT